MSSHGLRPLTAAHELAVLKRAPRLLPHLLAQGLPAEDAIALSHNAALLSLALADALSPKEVLERFSLREIADLCDCYREEVAL